jgi:nitrate/nitrite-specific signal transduction histidine kinase
VREGLRNVERHAQAHSANVSARVEDGVVTVIVEDDGCGLRAMQAEEGHVGLRLLASLMTDVGGHLELRDAEPTGTRLEARFPAVLAG